MRTKCVSPHKAHVQLKGLVIFHTVGKEVLGFVYGLMIRYEQFCDLF